MNKIFLIGRLTKAPELKEFGQNKVAKFSLAVDRKFKRDNTDNVDFFNVTVWNKTAEFCEKYLNKGNKIAIVGRIEIDKWTDTEGNTKNAVNVTADEVEALESLNSKDSPKNTDTKKDNNDSFDDFLL